MPCVISEREGTGGFPQSVVSRINRQLEDVNRPRDGLQRPGISSEIPSKIRPSPPPENPSARVGGILSSVLRCPTHFRLGSRRLSETVPEASSFHAKPRTFGTV